MPMPQPERRTAAGQATSTALNALWVMLGLAAGTVMMVVVVAYGTARFKAGPQPAQPLPVEAAIPSIVAPSAVVARPMPMPPQRHQASTRRAANGQFYFDTMVSGATVRMMFDTGAYTTILRAEDAGRSGIAVNGLDYSSTISTANGVAEVAPVMLDSLRVGDITYWGVPALVSRPGKLHVSLLGQTFMAKLASYRFEGSELILQGN